MNIFSEDIACIDDIMNKFDKRADQRPSLNRSQCFGCSTEYNTVTSNQVVYKSFCYPTNVFNPYTVQKLNFEKSISLNCLLGHSVTTLVSSSSATNRCLIWTGF